MRQPKEVLPAPQLNVSDTGGKQDGSDVGGDATSLLIAHKAPSQNPKSQTKSQQADMLAQMRAITVSMEKRWAGKEECVP